MGQKGPFFEKRPRRGEKGWGALAKAGKGGRFPAVSPRATGLSGCKYRRESDKIFYNFPLDGQGG